MKQVNQMISSNLTAYTKNTWCWMLIKPPNSKRENEDIMVVSRRNISQKYLAEPVNVKISLQSIANWKWKDKDNALNRKLWCFYTTNKSKLWCFKRKAIKNRKNKNKIEHTFFGKCWCFYTIKLWIEKIKIKIKKRNRKLGKSEKGE